VNNVTNEDSRPAGNSFWRDINATRVIVSTLGVLFAIGGIDHGFFETLQGNTPTGSLIVHAIGERNRMWAYGTEDAFTLIPNFLISGIVAIMVSAVIIVWSLKFVQKKHGSLVFLLLYLAFPGRRWHRASAIFHSGLGGLDPHQQTVDLVAGDFPGKRSWRAGKAMVMAPDGLYAAGIDCA
jgi:hypothetical protein